MHKPVAVVEVRIWDHQVGAVALDPRIEAYAFEYAPAFLATGIELAPLTMPRARAGQPFIFPDLPERTYHRLPALLADSLPDDFGNALINAWMASQNVAREQITPLDRLAYMGKRGFGALEFKPVRGPAARKSSAIEMAELVETARLALRGDFGSDDGSRAALTQLIQVGTSAGGARAKAAIAWNPASGEIRAGQFEVPPGFEPWLLKFDGADPVQPLGSSQGFGRIEYAYHLMARAAGIAMSDCRLLEENGRAHFMTRRFDRDGERKHHVQTLCAMAHLDYRLAGTHDVGQLLQTMLALHLGYDALAEAFRRIAFNAMAANCDDHPKNHSFLLREGGSWELAPAYDLTHAHNPHGQWTHQHLMAVNGKFAGITREDLLQLAARFGLGTAPRILEEVGAAVASWPQWAEVAGLDETAMGRVAKDHRLLVA
jgi:serine/threonine-protein kinase HipA